MNFNIVYQNQLYKRALGEYAKIYNKTPQKQRYKFLYPIIRSGITLSHAKELGFSASKYMWKSARNYSKRDKGKLNIIVIVFDRVVVFILNY